MRLFIAADLDENIRAGIQEVVEELLSRHKNAKFVEPGNLHFTLKFLGEVPETSLADIEKAISESIQGFKPFSINIHGMGYFGSRRFAKVVWVGAHEGREELARLASNLDSRLSSFRRDEKPPSPHITICRPKGESLKLIEDVERMRSRGFGSMGVSSITMKKSVLMPEGPVYENVKEFRF